MNGTEITRIPTPNGAEVSVQDIIALAEVLVPTGFLPDHIKTPGQAAAIILTGRELGMQPMRALRSLTMVKGKVVENADSQLARFKSDGGRATFTHLDETKAVLVLRHPNGDEHTETFTAEDAKRAGLLGNPSWQKFPKPMMRSRVITAGLKSVGWEGGAGTYDPDELPASRPIVVHEAAEDAPIVVEAAPAVQMAAPEQIASLEDMVLSEALTKTQADGIRRELARPLTADRAAKLIERTTVVIETASKAGGT